MTGTRIRYFICGFVLLGIASCIPTPVRGPKPKQVPNVDADQITQFSVINALMVGEYDGEASIGEMLEYGDFGLGTIDHLDGELIVLDGVAYQVRGDGVVAQVDSTRTTPFAVVTRLEADGEFEADSVASLAELDMLLDEKIEHVNNFVAIRVDGRVASITVRSVQRQEPPYLPLAQVAKSQGEWTHHDVAGTLIGIRSPAWVHGLNVPGYHWHFVSDDRRIGGHVLKCHLRTASIQYDICTNWLLKLPAGERFNSLDLTKDLRTELKQVERAREASDK